jgi:hypothetical protein
MPQGHGIFFHGPGMCGFQGAHILSIALPSVLIALEHVVAQLLQYLVHITAYFAKRRSINNLLKQRWAFLDKFIHEYCSFYVSLL